MDTVGEILAGRWGRELFSIAYPLFMIFLSGSGFVAISIAFNAITTHATCTVVWVVIAAVGTFLLASIQTLNKVGIVSWIGFVSVMAAIMIITVAVGIQDRPVTAPQVGPWDKVSCPLALGQNFHSFSPLAEHLGIQPRRNLPRRNGSRLYRCL
jgi:hypothetical protein